MAIKVNGDIVVDVVSGNVELKNVASITFGDASVQSTGVTGARNVTGSGLGTLLHTIKNPNVYSTGTYDYFGTGVATYGNYSIMGAYNEDVNGVTASGVAYVYDNRTGELVHTLNNPSYLGTTFGDYFGNMVAISDKYILVTAYAEESYVTGDNAGVVYVYDLQGNLLNTLVDPNAYSVPTNDDFGGTLAISGDYAAITASSEDAPTGTSSGAVYIFDLASGALLHTLTNPNTYSTAANDYFGKSIAINGNYLAVAATLEDPSTNSTGVVYVYSLESGTSAYMLTHPTGVSSSTFARDLDLNSKYLVVCGQEPSIGAQAIYIYDLQTRELVKKILNPLGGAAPIMRVRLTEKYLVAQASDSNNSNSVVIFNIDTWEQLAVIDNPNIYSTSTNDRFGQGFAVHGDYLVSVASFEDDTTGTDSGVAYIFQLESNKAINNIDKIYFANGVEIGSTLKRLGKVTASQGELLHTLANPNAYSTKLNDQFGWNVCISGNYTVIGTPSEDSAQGLASGIIYVFNTTTGQLLHTITNPNFYSTSSIDSFTVKAVHGDYLIAASINEDSAAGIDAGYVYVFELSTGSLRYTLSNPNNYSTSTFDQFGSAAAAHGSLLMVSATGEDSSTGGATGAVYLFDLTTGAYIKTFTSVSPVTQGKFGTSLALHGDYCVVGVPHSDVSPLIIGQVEVFSAAAGTRLYTITNPNTAGIPEMDLFGYSVATDGKYLVIGASGTYDDTVTVMSGAVYVYDISNGDLLYTLEHPDLDNYLDNDYFGWAFGISEDYLFIGADAELSTSVDELQPQNVPLKTVMGTIFIYDKHTGELVGRINNPDISPGNYDFFGSALAVSNNHVAVGVSQESYGDFTKSGFAFIFAARDLTNLDRLYTLVS